MTSGKLILCLVGASAVAASAFGQNLDPARDLFVMPKGIQSRWASGENRKGEKGKAGAEDPGQRKKEACLFQVKPGESRTLAEVAGQSGTVRRMWFTFSEFYTPKVVRSLRLDIYWDGASRPAVSAPLGDFMGIGWGQMASYQNALFSSPEGRSFNCYVPMPFKKGMKAVIVNESTNLLPMIFYEVDYTLGDPFRKDTLYFHSHWRRENPTRLQKDFEILPRVYGRGRYLGATISIQGDTNKYSTSWWGEGEVKVYLDGDRQGPTLSGTGTEDYIGSGWGMKFFANLYDGCLIADEPGARYSFYRLHVADPVYFYKDCRVTIQQIGNVFGPAVDYFRKTGLTYYHETDKGLERLPIETWSKDTGGLFEREDDWSACAWFYLDSPADNLPPLAPVAERTAGVAEK